MPPTSFRNPVFKVFNLNFFNKYRLELFIIELLPFNRKKKRVVALVIKNSVCARELQ